MNRDPAGKIIPVGQAPPESDTYLMILEEGELMQAKKDILIVGEEFVGPASESVKIQLEGITDLERLDRMVLRALKGASWQEILNTP